MVETSRQNVPHSPWPHRLAMALVCATFPLIWVGGLVTTYDAGMAVEDWPGTYGYNLLLYPWTTWWAGPFDLFIEHGHRLLGALVGLVTIGLVVVTFRYDARPRARYAAIGALLLVCAQGCLGGLRVLLDQRAIAMVHACVGPAFLAYAVALTAYFARGPIVGSRGSSKIPAADRLAFDRRGLRLALLTAAFIYLQLVLGASVRHMPVDASVNTFRFAVIFHLFMAFIVAGHGLMLAWCARRERMALRVPAMLLAALLLVQLGLGSAVWVVKYGWPFGLSDRLALAGTTIVANSLSQAMTVTAHVALGSLILALTVMIAARVVRLSPASRAIPLVAFAALWEVSP